VAKAIEAAAAAAPGISIPAPTHPSSLLPGYHKVAARPCQIRV